MSTNENKGKKAEVTALQAISAEDRKDWISLAFVQAGICVCVPAFLLGALLAEAMPIWPAIISGSLGYLIVVVGMVATGMIGCDLGLASCTCCQAGFGKSGARFIVSTIFAVNMIGWFGIQNGVCGEAFSNAMLAMTGWDIPVVVSNTIWGIIMLLTAVYGVHALEKLDKISIPLLMIIMCYGIFLAFKVYGTGNLNDEGTVQSMSFMSGVALSFNFTAVGTITGPDYTRFQKSRKDTVKSVFYGVFPMGVITLIMGIVLTKLSGQYDISMVLIEVGLPLLGIIALVISTWTTNSTNAYSAGLNIVMALKLKDNRRREATLISGIVGIVLCDLGILGHVEGVLSLLSYVVCPVGGVILADYWVVGKGKAKNFRPQDGVNWAGVIAWALGAIISYTLVKIEFVGIIIGFVIYLIAESLGKKMYAIGSTELGGENTAEALHVALLMDLPLIDADPAGRSVPELQHSTYYVKNVPIFPMGVATKFGEKIVIQNVADDLRAEDIVRAIAVVSDNLVGVADHANVGKVIKNSLIPGAITYAQEIGRVLRETKEAGGDVASAICDDKEGKVLFRGHISDYTCETRDGFNFGEIHLKGERDYTDEAYRIWFKNENIISYRNGEVDVIAPDLICMINGEGNPMTTPNFEVGDKMTVIALPSPEIWTTPEGLECFGPKHFGFDVEYKPFEK